MDNAQIRVKTESFRAIAKADIIISGVTVVTGENGSGKSTLSKLLYFLYKTTATYDTLMAKELWRRLQDVYRFLDIAQHELRPFSNEKIRRKELYKELSDLRRNITVDEKQMGKWVLLIEKTGEAYYSQPFRIGDSKVKNPRINRLRYIAKDILNKKTLEVEDKNTPIPFGKIGEFVESRFREAMVKVKSRPNSLFIKALENIFEDGKLPKIFEVFEYEEQIVSLGKNNLAIPYSIQNAIYIDTPMALGDDYSDIQHWEDLNKLVKKRGKLSFSDLSKTISDIINGDVTVNEDTLTLNDFLFKRKDGSEFNLLDCATGVKSFAILQLLLKNGSLTDKTLLIIDEPESNLHPQWIIEYARLIVLLNKEIGMKFFIASHNPDMVSALKYISEKEKTNKNLNFYLAVQQSKNKYLYKYKHLGTDIEPIFASFNIALERINQYGT